MTLTSNRMLAGAAIVLFAAGCSEQNFNEIDDPGSDTGPTTVEVCEEPPATILLELSFEGDGMDWTGECGPEVVSLQYDNESYTWVQPNGEDAIDCSDGPATFIRVTEVEALFTGGSVYEWSSYDTISLRGVVTLYDSTTLSEMLSFTFDVDTPFWGECDLAFVGDHIAEPSSQDYYVVGEGLYMLVTDPSYMPSSEE